MSWSQSHTHTCTQCNAHAVAPKCAHFNRGRGRHRHRWWFEHHARHRWCARAAGWSTMHNRHIHYVHFIIMRCIVVYAVYTHTVLRSASVFNVSFINTHRTRYTPIVCECVAWLGQWSANYRAGIIMYEPICNATCEPYGNCRLVCYKLRYTHAQCKPPIDRRVTRISNWSVTHQPPVGFVEHWNTNNLIIFILAWYIHLW